MQAGEVSYYALLESLTDSNEPFRASLQWTELILWAMMPRKLITNVEF